MSIALAATWHPHGELPRALRMIEDLTALYAALFIVVPREFSRDVSALGEHPIVELLPDVDWYGGRHHAVCNALASGPTAIHYCDFDRLLHWLECYPTELAATLTQMSQTDCLITGRSERAWATHPRCMIETEILFNRMFSHLFASDLMDFGAGSRGLSHRAAAYLMQFASSDWGWAVDAAWPLLLHRAGYTYAYAAVEGLEWETPDRYRDAAANPAARTALVREHDQSPDIWQRRVHVAHEITRVGLLAAQHSQQENSTNG